MASAPRHRETDGAPAQVGPRGPGGADQRRGGGAAGGRARGLGLTHRFMAARLSQGGYHAGVLCGRTPAVLGVPAHPTASRAGEVPRRLCRQERRGVFPMSRDDASVPTSHLIPVDHATRHPGHPCGARPWLQGVLCSQGPPCEQRQARRSDARHPAMRRPVLHGCHVGYPYGKASQMIRCGRRGSRLASACGGARHESSTRRPPRPGERPYDCAQPSGRAVAHDPHQQRVCVP